MTTSSFSKLKSYSKQNTVADLTDKLNQLTNKRVNFNKDEELFWQPTADAAGNGTAIIRFLPAPKDEDIPFVRIFSYGFRGPTGSWYIANSPTTIGLPDPVAELNTRLWNTGKESDKNIARSQKRRTHFVVNVYIVDDPGNPENNGKVFYFKFGPQIFDKIEHAFHPPFDSEGRDVEDDDYNPTNAFDPFNLWTGANFKLEFSKNKKTGYRTYENSRFLSKQPLYDDDSKMEEIWLGAHSLQQLHDPSKFQSYEELKERLLKVLDTTVVIGKSVETREDDIPFAPQVDVPKGENPSVPENMSEEDEIDEEFDKLLKQLADEKD